jgi:hypothetical protein
MFYRTQLATHPVYKLKLSALGLDLPASGIVIPSFVRVG